jgi:ribosome-associated protein
MKEDALNVARSIVDILEDKKGEDILLLELIGVCDFTDYFILCTGASERTIKALATDVRKKVKENYSIRDQGVEGDADSGWVLIDYGDIILHLFSRTNREYYQLEELWREGKILVRVQ